MFIVGQMSLGASTTGKPFPLWEQCLASLRDKCDALYLRFDSRTGDPAVLDALPAVCGGKLKDVLVSKTKWNRWNWREEMIRMLDGVKPDMVLAPDQDEEFGPGLLDELYLLAASSHNALMFAYRVPPPTADGFRVWQPWPRGAHMKAYKWRRRLTYRPYKSYAKVTNYAARKHWRMASTQILHYAFYTPELRAARSGQDE